MKKKLMSVTVAIIFLSLTITTVSHAEEPTTSLVAEPTTTGTAVMKDKSDEMMATMDANHMKGMMRECMKMHKDSKMCKHEAMTQCEEKMGKAECSKMMKQMHDSKKVKN